MPDSLIPSHVPRALVADVDIYDLAGARSDPQLAWKAVERAGSGVVWTPRNGGHWIATSAELIWELFPDVDRLSAREISVPPGHNIYPMIPNQSDDPEHRFYRRILMPFLLPKAVRRLQEAVRSLTIALIESFRSKGACEFIADFARHLPMRIFLSMVDLPDEDRPWLIERAEILVRSGDLQARETAQLEMVEYLQKWIDLRRERPGDDLLSAIIHGTVGDRAMTDTEVMGEALDVMFGGLDTVASMMGFIMRHLATHPAQYATLVADPARIPLAVEELLRRYGVAAVARLVVRDIALDAVTIRAGDMIVLPTCLHGLDESVWHDPQMVDFDRRRQTHATFGNGIHTCPGAGLARSEITVMIEEWTRRIPSFGLSSGDPPLASSGAVNGMLRLALCWPVADKREIDQ